MLFSGDRFTSSAFELEHVNKTYRSREGTRITAIENVSFRSEAGNISCIIGPTGSGKSTLLRLLAGLETPDSGTVSIASRSPSSLRGEIGYITQSHTLFPWLTVSGNIALPLSVRGTAKDATLSEVSRLCESLGLKGSENLYPHELSGGMQQRTSFCRLLAGKARYWLLDEPFSSLDERTRYQMQRLLLDLIATHGLSVLFVTHDIDEAVFLGDRILILSPGPGRVVRDERLTLDRPRNRLSPQYGTVIEKIRKGIETTIHKGSEEDRPIPKKDASISSL